MHVCSLDFKINTGIGTLRHVHATAVYTCTLINIPTLPPLLHTSVTRSPIRLLWRIVVPWNEQIKNFYYFFSCSLEIKKTLVAKKI